MISKITASLADLAPELTAHAQGAKQVFLRNGDTPTNVTQVAYGVFANTDYCEMHAHATMEECFFFLKGEGKYTVDGTEIALSNGVFVRIPAGIPHRLEATGNEPLEYVYFGVATE
ncbi:cupin domain-containing protein [Spirosoma utsteinense]|uniref:Mannose-6-phosphate isomerase-like protein (Cupin superfamily) n=1 Tax=Spirosoma utsteinense TaxID=2585773 RepID=A0ABR6W7X1_9BACT|nr:cupin domain-containing protein [Spirosoma utsteinense]MBC3787712.1 mannose-6-phosphate isomerase-like protein (cupin superfamily) [Spirosoma utsteinense]MBC3792684.1 mannose-6-phosphate isomerase-like protein (cupin superfamily) [Spirosoma utsteinense]